jgi:hypothetical protein
MTTSIFLYALLVIISFFVPIKLNSDSRLLLSISSCFIGAAVITAVCHSDMDKAKWIIVGLNSIGIITYYIRYRVIRNKR